jgi:S-adenosylmethionine:tRNA-ribosyltransferase-isomerase (queuine synthetase)
VGDQHPAKPKDSLRLAMVNCNGAAGKQAEIGNMCEYLDPDIIIMTETKIDYTVNHSEF